MGRKPNDKPAFPEGMLEAVVTGDKRIQTELAPAAKAIGDVMSFNEFQKIRAEFPDASADEITKIWASRLDKAGATYAAKLGAYLNNLYDAFMVVARFRTRDDKFGEQQKIGLGPASDEVKAILSLTAFRNMPVVKTVRFWASAIRPTITKHSAADLWNKKLRHRKQGKEFEEHINESKEFF